MLKLNTLPIGTSKGKQTTGEKKETTTTKKKSNATQNQQEKQAQTRLNLTFNQRKTE